MGYSTATGTVTDAREIGTLAGFANSIASATAPNEPVDTIAPTISILSPADGAEVAGTLEIAIQADDNQGLAYVEVSTVINSTTRVICSRSLSGQTSVTGSCRVNASRAPVGSYPLTAFVSDMAGNSGTARITVNVVAVASVASAD